MVKIRHQKTLSLAIVCSQLLAVSSGMAARAADAPAGPKGALQNLPKNASPLAVHEALDKELLALENRFFFHHYGHDPVEKRLERLELMTLGGAQYGTNTDRLTRLKAAIVQRDHNAAKTMAAQSKAQPAKGASESEAKYPVLSTLEWRVLKKTYAAESLDQRLNRLETSLFGVPAQAMSYVDRIDRLKKTAGVGVDEAGPYTAIGPASRNAIPRGPMPRSGGENFGFHSERLFINGKEVPLPNGGSSEFFDGVPDINQFNGFGNGFGSGFPEGGSEFKGFPGNPLGEGAGSDNIFERFQKPMADLLRSFGFAPQMAGDGASSDGAGESPFQRFAVPKGNDTGNQYLNEPLPNFKKQPTPREQVPPYHDPNSI